jgi:hypothetical protein
VKKPIISVDDLEDSGDEAPSPSMDLTASVFAIRNALVTESATVWATLIQFQDTLAGSLDRLMEFIVKEQAKAQENHCAVQDLLQQLVRAAEGAPSRQTETVPATAVGNAEAGPSEAAVGLIRRARTPLFLPSDENMEPSDESYVDEAKGSGSGRKEGSEEGSADENVDVEEDVDEDVEEADEMDVDETLRD